MFNSRGKQAKGEPLNKEFILKRVAEEDLLCHYLGMTEIPFNRLIISPLREDRNPTCSFKRTQHGIYLKDFNGDFYGDVFDIVQRLKNCTFKEALIIVKEDFIVSDKPESIDYTKKLTEYKEEEARKKVIQVKRRKWNKIDKEYWGKYQYSSKDLEHFRISPVEHVWVDGELRYTYKNTDPGYAYFFGNGDYKIYFPLREKYRFLSNGPHLQGWCELDMSSDLIIYTKSMKDVVALWKLGFSSIAPPAEGALIDPDTVEILRNYDGLILFDNDEVGIKWAVKNSEKYNIPYNYLEVGDAIKDVSDLVKEVGLDRAREIINDLIKNKKHVSIIKKNRNLFKHKWNSRGD